MIGPLNCPTIDVGRSYQELPTYLLETAILIKCHCSGLYDYFM